MMNEMRLAVDYDEVTPCYRETRKTLYNSRGRIAQLRPSVARARLGCRNISKLPGRELCNRSIIALRIIPYQRVIVMTQVRDNCG